ncbi:MAG: class I SAM-dependent methyltransferase [Planctomycetota bacterium]|nr:class I SAM-dependent methyltransferase [Planctomycetota bacterium]
MPISPMKILETNWSFTHGRVLHTGVELGVFDALAKRSRGAAEVARRCKATPRGMRMLLDALAAMGFLRKKRGRQGGHAARGSTGSACASGWEYSLAPISAEYLVKGKETYIGGMVRHAENLMSRWQDLAARVRGHVPKRLAKARGPGMFVHLADSLFPSNFPSAKEAAAKLVPRRAQIATRSLEGRHRELPPTASFDVLDIGCGAAPWSIAMALRRGDVRVVANDFELVLPVAKKYALRYGVADRFSYLPGNLREVDFGVGRFDLVILGNICHSEGERGTKILFGKVRRALKPGGRVAIIEILPNRHRTGPLHPLLFALNMLVGSGEGDVFSFEEYAAWLRETGFSRVKALPMENRYPFIVGTAPVKGQSCGFDAPKPGAVDEEGVK